MFREILLVILECPVTCRVRFVPGIAGASCVPTSCSIQSNEKSFFSVLPRKKSARRDGRAAEGARLESVYTGNRIEGSNPSLSARLSRSENFPQRQPGGEVAAHTVQPATAWSRGRAGLELFRGSGVRVRSVQEKFAPDLASKLRRAG